MVIAGVLVWIISEGLVYANVPNSWELGNVVFDEIENIFKIEKPF